MNRLATALLACACLAGCTDEEPTKPAPKRDQAAKQTKKTKKPGKQSRRQSPLPANAVEYPRDKDLVVVTVNGINHTLEQVVARIDERHFKGFKALVAMSAGRFELQTPQLADWVRQYADVIALRTEARKRGVKEQRILEESGHVVADAFAAYAKAYVRKNNRAFPTDAKAIQAIRDQFLKRRGLGLEVEGLLNALVPDNLDQNSADAYYKRNRQSVNGVINVAHILIKNRDPRTGRLLSGDAIAKVRRKINAVRERLQKGENFGVVARDLSEDRVTAAGGGEITGLRRFDPQMPASFCRAAWSMNDREWKGPITTKYGIHFIQRIKYLNNAMVLRLLANEPRIRRYIRRHRKEDLLFEVRKTNAVELKY